MNILSMWSWIAIIFGLLILAKPDILAYLVALFFILLGLNGLVFSGRLKKIFQIRVDR